MMDAALIIGGVVDTIYRNAIASEMHEIAGGFWVAAPSGEVYGGFLYSDGFFTEPYIEPAQPPPPVPRLVASGNFTVADGQIENLSVVSALPAACAVDTGTYWIFFSEVQPDTSYIVGPFCSEGRVNVKARYEDYFEICVKDDGGALIDPSEFSVSIVRTQ